MRYCGFLPLPSAVLRYSYPPYAPPPFTERSSELKFGGIFFKHYWLSLLSQKVCCLLSSSVRSLLWRSSHWPSCFAERSRSVFAFFTYHERDRWHMKYEPVFMLFVWLFFFYLLSSYKRAWGSIKLVWDWKLFGTARQKKTKKTKKKTSFI